MKNIQALIERNHSWAEEIRETNPEFFEQLSKEQTPNYLWIGCSDSRVPANVVTNLEPGELFVHRNIANSFYQVDMNALSVLYYAVEALDVDYIFVCGHYGCGGVQSALSQNFDDLPMHWVQPIRTIAHRYEDELNELSEDEKVNKVCEYNVKYQVRHIAQSSIVQKAWKNDKTLYICGLIYDLKDGHLEQLTPRIDKDNYLKFLKGFPHT